MTHRRPITATVAGLAASLLLCACGGSPAPLASAAASNSSNVATTSPPDVATSAATSAVAAAGDASSAPASGGTACTLVTEQDATAALGADPGPGNGAVRAKGSTCAYGGTGALSVNVTMVPAGGKSAFDGSKSSDPGPGDAVVDVPGVGDGAFGIFHAPFATVEFYKGDTFVSVMVSSTTGDTTVTPKDQAIALATAAAARA